MQNKARIYGEVLKEVLEKIPEQKRKILFQNFKNLLKKRGDLRLLSRAVQEFKTAWENRKGKKGTVVFAKTPSSSARGSVAKTLRRQGFVYEQIVDPRLGGGAKIFLGNDYLIDNTVQGKLMRIFVQNS
jgi:F0F1-type ATP synthase delta subunit